MCAKAASGLSGSKHEGYLWNDIEELKLGIMKSDTKVETAVKAKFLDVVEKKLEHKVDSRGVNRQSRIGLIFSFTLRIITCL